MTDDKVKARIAAWLAEPGVTATQRQLQDDVRALQAEGAELAGEVTDYEQAFKLRWDADMRAIKRWQAEAPGRELTWPDHADLCVWLMGRIDAAEAKLTALVEAARPLAQSADHHDATDRHYKIKRGDKATVSIPLGWLRQIRQALAHHSAPVVEGVPGICGETGEPCSKADQDCAHDCLGKPPSHPKAALSPALIQPGGGTVMREELRPYLSPENKALFERNARAEYRETHCRMEWATLNRLLDAARSEGRAKPPQGDVGADSGLASELADVLVMTGCKNRQDLEDMANVGQSLMERIHLLTQQEGPFHNWTPADDPAEIVFDLVNHYEDQQPAADDNHEALVEALEKIRAIKREPIGGTGFATGPLAHFQAAQRIAAEALAAFQSRQEGK